MSGLIDRAETIRAWCKLTCGCEPEECTMTIERDGAEECNFVEFLWNRPEYDYERDEEVVLVGHAHWIALTECANEGVYCSHCRKKVYKRDYSNTMKVRSKFCPNCGFKMDEVTK